MKLTRPSCEILTPMTDSIIRNIELCGRVCYKSESKITESSASEFIKMLIKRGHESVLEHEKLSVRFICDRGVSHELVRHRIASFSQESTRYCNYKGGVEFIVPEWFCSADLPTMNTQESPSLELLNQCWTPQQARTVLPNSLKTEIIVTANMREWRTIFKQRTSSAAHPKMREIMNPLLAELQVSLPDIFGDL